MERLPSRFSPLLSELGQMGKGTKARFGERQQPALQPDGPSLPHVHSVLFAHHSVDFAL